MAQQTVLDKTVEKQYSLNYFLGIASSFKNPDNRKLTYDGYWTFDKIDAVLRLWIAPFKPELENASFEEILEFLTQLVAENQTEATVPSPAALELLEEELDQSKLTTEEIRQKALDQARKKIAKYYVKKELVIKLASSQITEEERNAVANSLSKHLQEGLETSDLPVITSKLDQTPSGTKDYTELQKLARERYLEIWQEAVAKSVEENRLSVKATGYLNSFSSPVLYQANPIGNLKQIHQYRQQIADAKKPEEKTFFEERIRILTQQQTNNLARVIARPMTLSKAKFFVETFLQTYPDNLVSFSPEEAVIVTFWQMVGSEVRLQPEEFADVFTQIATASPSEIAAYQQLSSFPSEQAIDLMQLKSDDGLIVADRIKEQLLAKGLNIDSENEQQLIQLRHQIQAIEAAYKGLSQQDLKIQIENLLKMGLIENSREIRELRGTLQALIEVHEKTKRTGFLEKQILAWRSNGKQSVRLSFLHGITIERTIPVSRKRFFLSFLNPFKKKGLADVQIIYSLFNLIKKPKAALGPRILIFLRNIGSQFASLFVKIVSKIIPPRTIKSTTAKFGDFLSGFLSGQNQTVNSLRDSSQSFLSALSNPTIFSTKGSGKAIKITGAVLTLLLAIIIFTVGSAFTSKADYFGTESPETPSSDAYAQCETSRHFSEKVYCVLKECGQTFVSRASILNVATCLSKSNLNNKALVSSLFYNSSPLSCVTFVYTTERAIGHNLESKTSACRYFTNPPSNYKLIPGTEKPQVGDIAIWNATLCGGIAKSAKIADRLNGHSAIVLGIDGNVTLFAAEANGYTGEIRIKSYIFGNPDDLVSPNGFLRYKDG